MPQTDLITAMRDPGLYSLPVDHGVEFIQTHISCLFLTLDDVYKLKKPVDLGFLDFSTLEKRHLYCQEEVRLNSRLAPTVYLGVLPVCKFPDGQYVLGREQDADIVDYVVHMRRLSEECMLPALFRQGLVDADTIEELAGLLAAFHSTAQPVPEQSAMGSFERVAANIDENFAQTGMLRDHAVSSIRHTYMRRIIFRILDRDREVFIARHAQGKTRECHGDLRMEHICRFQGRLIAFDCIEFNERFRFIDTAADLAFLLMDMEFNGYWSQATALCEAYMQAADDGDARKVFDVYKAYYALTRGKVFGIESTEEEFSPEEQRHALDMAAQFFALAWSYVHKAKPPVVILLCGLMGTGKSEVARHLSRELETDVLRSDVLRKALYRQDAQDRRYDAYGHGLYTPEATRATYRALVDRGREMLNQGESVILDASFSRREYRNYAFDAAKELNAGCVLVECVCPDPVLIQRLRQRNAQGTDPSDGRPSLLSAQKRDFEPVAVSKSCRHVVVDTSEKLPAVQEKALQAVLEALYPET
ncbi:AAA family ATPase [Desulfovermiculus halophilus]|jgi:hypothetical protein|uniref:bifunctional aminoglycoside phosphotransferase/ATP-binding protein n=1 Tax=Desulfovermiculus halophilus TaxID=339722 RepID=UPI0004835903|nr:bifunctional aminoglycoside phosphotransferase/ATP-binding protein [Desulfovermiculus halophilus]